MGSRSLVPGNFSHTSVGRSKHARTGWQRFRMLDSDSIIEDPQSVADTVTENATSTSFTFAQHTATADKSPIMGYVSAKPLRDSEGRLLSFSDCFSLRVRIELISLSGHFKSSTDGSTTESKPQCLFGVCANSSNFDADDNKHMSMGWRNKADSDQGESIDTSPVLLKCTLQTDGTGQVITNVTGGIGGGTKIFESQYIVGPDLDDGNNSHMINQVYGPASEDFDRASGSTLAFQNTGLNANQGNWGTGQVYLFFAVSDCNSVNSSADPCTFVFRASYMVEASTFENGGFGTS